MKQKKYFTIRGYQKSGTNWLSNVVNRHPEIFCRGEYHLEILNKATFKYLDNPFRSNFETEVLRGYRSVVRNILVKDVNNDNIVWYGDRTPTALYPRLLPRAKQLFIVRDGRDVMVSQIYHRLRHGYKGAHLNVGEFKRLYDKHPFMHDRLAKFSDNVNYFEENPNELLKDETYVRFFAGHWAEFIKKNFEFVEQENEKNAGRVMVIRYSDLRNDYENEIKRVFGFFGLSTEKLAAINDKNGPGLTRVDNLSLYRKGVSGDWVRYFDDEVLGWFMEEAEEAITMLEDKRILSL